jgi:hypothetical protein
MSKILLLVIITGNSGTTRPLLTVLSEVSILIFLAIDLDGE